MRKQSSILCALATLYIVAGICWFTLVENFSVLDALYTLVIMLTAVGYGLRSNLGQSTYCFLIFYILLGVGLLTLILAVLCQSLMDSMIKHKIKKSFFILNNNLNISDNIFQFNEAEAEKKTFLVNLKSFIFSRALYVVMWLAWLVGGGLLVGMGQEKWSIVHSLYFSVVSATTVGFGDFSPETDVAKVICIIYLPITVGTTLVMVTKTFTFLVLQFSEEKNEKYNMESNLLFDKMLDSKILVKLITEGNEIRANDLTLMLLLNHEDCLSEKILNIIKISRKAFKRLDYDGDGKLSLSEIKNLSKRLSTISCKPNQDECPL